MFQRIRKHEAEEAVEDAIEGGEQMSLIDEIIGDITEVDADAELITAVEALEDSGVHFTESTEDDGEPSADDYQDLGE